MCLFLVTKKGSNKKSSKRFPLLNTYTIREDNQSVTPAQQHIPHKISFSGCFFVLWWQKCVNGRVFRDKNVMPSLKKNCMKRIIIAVFLVRIFFLSFILFLALNVNQKRFIVSRLILLLCSRKTFEHH